MYVCVYMDDNLREEGHQEIVLLEVSHTAIVPELFGLVTIALDRARGQGLRPVHPARNGVEKRRLARSGSTENNAY